MAGQRGRDILIKVSDGAGGFVTAAGIRTTQFDLAAGLVEGTNADSPDGWREVIPGAGVKSLDVAGAGVFKSATSDARFRALFFADEAAVMQLVVPGFGTFEGSFCVRSLSLVVRILAKRSFPSVYRALAQSVLWQAHERAARRGRTGD